MLHIDTKVIAELSLEALQKYPNECCGFLLGFETKKNRFINEILVVENVAEKNKKRRFKIASLDYLKAENYAEEKGLTLLGIYHSHPNYPSVPSEHDRVAAQPYFSYVILSINKQNVQSIQSWILNDKSQFEEEQIFQNKELTNFKIKDLWLQS